MMIFILRIELSQKYLQTTVQLIRNLIPNKSSLVYMVH